MDEESVTGQTYRDFQNVEGNIQTPLLGIDLDSSAPPWQSDKAHVRLPARSALCLARFLSRRTIIWFVSKVYFFALLIVVLVGSGTYILQGIGRGDFSFLSISFILFAATAIVMGVATKVCGGDTHEAS
jgi:hypothetical protein